MGNGAGELEHVRFDGVEVVVVVRARLRFESNVAERDSLKERGSD